MAKMMCSGRSSDRCRPNPKRIRAGGPSLRVLQGWALSLLLVGSWVPHSLRGWQRVRVLPLPSPPSQLSSRMPAEGGPSEARNLSSPLLSFASPPAPEARHNLAQPARAGKAEKRIKSAVGATHASCVLLHLSSKRNLRAPHPPLSIFEFQISRALRMASSRNHPKTVRTASRNTFSTLSS